MTVFRTSVLPKTLSLDTEMYLKENGVRMDEYAKFLYGTLADYAGARKRKRF
jgi:hypothetical protein